MMFPIGRCNQNFSEICRKARRRLLALEAEAENLEEPFLKKAFN